MAEITDERIKSELLCALRLARERIAELEKDRDEMAWSAEARMLLCTWGELRKLKEDMESLHAGEGITYNLSYIQKDLYRTVSRVDKWANDFLRAEGGNRASTEPALPTSQPVDTTPNSSSRTETQPPE
jgi:hypothetical protein